MIAVTFALPSESTAFVRLLQNPTRGAYTVSGTLEGRKVCILHTGVGQRCSTERLAVFLRNQTPQLLISSGFAGALSGALPVGSVFVAENFTDPELARRSALPSANLATVSQVSESREDREELARRTGAAAVDMETQWIAESCGAARIPMLAVRVISDSIAEPLPAPARVLFDVNRQRTPFLKLAVYLLRHPMALPQLIRFAKRIAGARANLTQALTALCAM